MTTSKAPEAKEKLFKAVSEHKEGRGLGGGGLLRRLVDTEESCEAANMTQREAQGRERKVTGGSSGGGDRGGGGVFGQRQQQIRSNAATITILRPDSSSLTGRGITAGGADCSPVTDQTPHHHPHPPPHHPINLNTVTQTQQQTHRDPQQSSG